MKDRLLIIADDFTGALDTGIQFTKMGIRVRILTDYLYDFEKLSEKDALLSVTTDSRPLLPEESYKRVFLLAKNARKAGFPYVYKKTDSGLRGNIGMELKAAMDAYEENSAAFIPALPGLNRVTRGGVQYIDGVPARDSVFGRDPFEPVRYSFVADIIRSQADLNVVIVPRNDYESAFNENSSSLEKTVYVFDAESDEDLFKIADFLKFKKKLSVLAGCAGFAGMYERLLSFEKGALHQKQKTEGLLTLCGSVNPITIKQLDFAEKKGFTREHLTNEQKLNLAFWPAENKKSYFDDLLKRIQKTDKYIIDAFRPSDEESVESYAEKNGVSVQEIRFRIADSFGHIAKALAERDLNYTLCLTGGDTLMGFMRCTGIKELAPIAEIGKGAVLSLLRCKEKSVQVISKSGGFGENDIFIKMYKNIKNVRGCKI